MSFEKDSSLSVAACGMAAAMAGSKTVITAGTAWLASS